MTGRRRRRSARRSGTDRRQTPDVKGFIVTDYFAERDQAIAELEGWVAANKLKVQEDVIAGLENTPGALIGLLAGHNRGKRMVKVA